MSVRKGWRHLKRGEACPVCGRGDNPLNRNTHCLLTDDKVIVNCQKSGGMPFGNIKPFKVTAKGGSLYRLIETGGESAFPEKKQRRPPRVNFNRLFEELWWPAVKTSTLATHASHLGVSLQSLERLQIGWASTEWDDRKKRSIIVGTTTPCMSPGAWVFPMRNEIGDIVGVRVRTASGAKFAIRGSSGDAILIPIGLHPHEPLLIPEGPTSTAALLTIGCNAAGRPSCDCGAAAIAGLVDRLQPSAVVLVGDNDERYDNRFERFRWPGKEGAERTSTLLAGFGVESMIVFPPSGMKDVREWIKSEIRKVVGQ